MESAIEDHPMYGIPERMTTTLKSRYERTIIMIRAIERKVWFEVEAKVKQGSILSPLLFAVG